MTIREAQQQIIDDFSFFEDWQDRYNHLISLGKSLAPIPVEDKQPENLVKGCQSNVWLGAHLENGNVVYTADSDAILPKGIAALLVQVYSGHTPQEILKSNEDFIAKIGLQEFLSPTRANGLLAMIKQIKFYAIAFDAKNA
ncbi:SufE family protein [Ornithobacterium rhinotracheale]